MANRRSIDSNPSTEMGALQWTFFMWTCRSYFSQCTSSDFPFVSDRIYLILKIPCLPTRR
jgi:hypothetical protein